MIALYSINAAWAHHQERETGSIEPGNPADLVVLDRNLFEVPVSRIHESEGGADAAGGEDGVSA